LLGVLYINNWLTIAFYQTARWQFITCGAITTWLSGKQDTHLSRGAYLFDLRVDENTLLRFKRGGFIF
jgi:hypothetical protein